MRNISKTFPGVKALQGISLGIQTIYQEHSTFDTLYRPVPTSDHRPERGGQQRVVLAKRSNTNGEILISDEPPHGIDVGPSRRSARSWEIDTIAMVAIGGTALRGGKGSMLAP